MTIIESSAIINKPIAEVFAHLSDFNNYQVLMPPNIEKWSSTYDEAKFTIQNMIKLALKITDRLDNKTIVAKPTEPVPFDINLKWELEDKGEQTLAKFVIEADLNMMMKMVASGPLQKLTDYSTNKLKEVLA